MASQLGPNGSSRPLRPRRHAEGWTIRITPAGLLLLVVINLVLMVGWALGGWAYGINHILPRPTTPAQAMISSPANTTSITATSTQIPPTSSPTSQPSETSTIQPPATSYPEQPTASPQPISTLGLNQELLILALDDGGNTHLFAYQPEESGAGQPLPLTRLTYGPWDDITPAISPDGRLVAFASNRSGYWDIYLLDLGSSGITRLTDTLGYEASPAWSPDSKWLVYEAYVNSNLEIKIQSIENPNDSFQLTNNQAADFSPTWSPQGRQIAFVSNRSGENEVWLADLDKSEDQRFQNISNDPLSKDTRPAWAPDGSTLAWVGEQDGIRNLYIQELSSTGENNQAQSRANHKSLGSGDWPVWSADGKTILTLLQAPNHVYLTAYSTQYSGLTLPTIELPGAVYGLTWGVNALTPTLSAIYQQVAEATSTPLYLPAITAQPAENGGRYQLVQLNGVAAPHPYLHDLIDESYIALRDQIAREAGWDYLANLENAYVPLTAPLDPGMGSDWLYTGRAFSVNSLPLNSGWMVVIRENFGTQAYWRVYLRALYQDGSAGSPLHDQPWDFEARYNGDTTIYEQGGTQQTSIPPGYWIDFTDQALAYGWERLPALVTWRAFFPAARFSEFVDSGGLDWQTAMLELYPPEAMVTPTAVIPPTRTPTPTLRWYVSPTPTLTPTPRPTFTPGITPSSNPSALTNHVATGTLSPGG